MKTTEFIKKYAPCLDGAEFAGQFETMSEVWENCQRPEWLFWILEKHAPLEKAQSVTLAIAFAESALEHWTSDDQRPRQAIDAARAWLDNPCDVTTDAAESAAESAARSAARSAAESAQCEIIRNTIPNPFVK